MQKKKLVEEYKWEIKQCYRGNESESDNGRVNCAFEDMKNELK